MVACIKILQALGERGDTVESLDEAHSITLDMLRQSGIILPSSGTASSQPGFVTSTPGAQIDKNFAASRVNSLLLSNGNPPPRSCELLTSKDALQKTLKQLSQCGPETIETLVNFNGYVQTPAAVVQLSKLLATLRIRSEPKQPSQVRRIGMLTDE